MLHNEHGLGASFACVLKDKYYLIRLDDVRLREKEGHSRGFLRVAVQFNHLLSGTFALIIRAKHYYRGKFA